ncbi:uncharacterized protein LOC135478069 [Liolophura sinensis]|uniref:uncharacterized protein LOC135478069 n=1 Tax=Liolophura sinensis TaxID=3198878 RepID=UPI0031593DE8
MLKVAFLVSLLVIVLAVLSEAYFDPEDNELEDKEREIQTMHKIDNPFPAIRDYRVWRSDTERPRPMKRTFCPRGFVHNPVTAGCVPSLGFMKGQRRWSRR